jgi:hypothetical protein
MVSRISSFSRKCSSIWPTSPKAEKQKKRTHSRDAEGDVGLREFL